MPAAVPADLHFRNGRVSNPQAGGFDSRLPFGFKGFYLLSAVTDDPISTFAQAKAGQPCSPGDPIHAGSRTSPTFL
jgi:hypothetical protein